MFALLDNFFWRQAKKDRRAIRLASFKLKTQKGRFRPRARTSAHFLPASIIEGANNSSLLRLRCQTGGRVFVPLANELKRLKSNSGGGGSAVARGPNYKMGKTREILQEILNPIEAAHKCPSIPLHRDRIYCLDNESFEHLCLIKKANVSDHRRLDLPIGDYLPENSGQPDPHQRT
uniref:Uncharacterized protein n=1 Tax=Globodera rostochiensis TaxID=31243 RepID=A0A914HFA3_GLORO